MFLPKYILIIYILGIFVEEKVATYLLLLLFPFIPILVYFQNFFLAEKVAVIVFTLFSSVAIVSFFKLLGNKRVFEPIQSKPIKISATMILFVYLLLSFLLSYAKQGLG